MAEVTPHAVSFANHVITDWNEAMDMFFGRCDHKRRARGLSDADVRDALAAGYPDEVVDAWDEWASDE